MSTPADVPQAALDLAESAPVFPCWGITSGGTCVCGDPTCGSPGKHPAISGGLKSASQDAKQVQAWFADRTDLNVAICTGHGFIVLDVDGKDGFDSLRALYGARWYGGSDEPFVTVLAHTGSGRGLHVFFRTDNPTIRNSTSKLAHGLDVRGTGGYIVAPPSRHVSGGTYQWVRGFGPGEVDMAPLPDWLEQAMLASQGRRSSRAPSPSGATPTGDAQVSCCPPWLVQDLDNREWSEVALRILHCEELYPHGEHYGNLWSLACHLVWKHRAGDEELLQVLGPSIAAMGCSKHDLGFFAGKLQEARAEFDAKNGPLRGADGRVMFAQRALPAGNEPVALARVESPVEGAVVLGRKLTDLGNAERLADQFGDQLRFAGGRWVSWDGKRWVPDAESTVHQLAHLTVRGIDLEAFRCTDDTLRGALRKHATASEAVHRLAAMVGEARFVKPIRARVEDFDKDPMVFNVQNGTIDLKTGELGPHRREDLLTQLAPVSYDPTATCPRWDRFLEEVLPDPEVRAYLQRFAGYSLTGLVSEQVLPFLHGGGANGKTVFVNVLMDLLGTYAKVGAPDLLVAKKGETHPTELADVAGARLVVCAETEQGRWIAEQRVKLLTGEDRIKARFMHKDLFEFWSTAKLILVGNHEPRVRGTDLAFWRRLRLIPFSVTIPEEHRDRGLPEKLRAELSGILNWALAGCRAWQECGLGTPAAVTEATKGYQAREDHVGGFVADVCEPGGEVSFQDLFRRYTTWVLEDNGRAWSKKAVTKELRRLGYAVEQASTRAKTLTVFGLKLKSAFLE